MTDTARIAASVAAFLSPSSSTPSSSPSSSTAAAESKVSTIDLCSQESIYISCITALELVVNRSKRTPNRKTDLLYKACNVDCSFFERLVAVGRLQSESVVAIRSAFSEKLEELSQEFSDVLPSSCGNIGTAVSSKGRLVDFLLSILEHRGESLRSVAVSVFLVQERENEGLLQSSVERILLRAVTYFFSVISKDLHVLTSSSTLSASAIIGFELAYQFQLLVHLNVVQPCPLFGPSLQILMCAAVRSALVVGSSYHLDFRTILAVSKFPLIYHPVIMKMVTSSSSRRQGIQLEAFPSTVEGFKSCYSRLVQADSGYLFLRYCSRTEAIRLLSSASLGAFLLRPSGIEDETNAKIVGSVADPSAGIGVVFYLSFRGLSAEGVKHATVRRETTDRKVTYRCGKIETATLWDLFKAVENVLAYDFLFDYALLPNAPFDGLNLEDSEDIYCDLNSDIWEDLKDRRALTDTSEVYGTSIRDKGGVNVNDEDDILAQYYSKLGEIIHEKDWISLPLPDSDLWNLYILTVRFRLFDRLSRSLRGIFTSKIIQDIDFVSIYDKNVICDVINEPTEKFFEILLSPLHDYAKALRCMVSMTLCPNPPGATADNLMSPPLIVAERIALDMLFFGVVDSIDKEPQDAIGHVPYTMHHHAEMHSLAEQVSSGPSRVATRQINPPSYWLTGGSALSAARNIPEKTAVLITQGDVFIDGFELSDGCTWLTKNKSATCLRDVLEDGFLGVPPSPFNILNWMKQTRTLRVLKQGSNTSFSTQQTYLSYIDPWQVTSIVDHAQQQSPEATFANLGRQKYCPLGFENTGDSFIDRIVSVRELEKSAMPLKSVWMILGGNRFFIQTISSVHPQTHREASAPVGRPGSVADDAYFAVIEQHLYRNALFSRCFLPHRYVGIVTVKILGLRDVNVQKHRGLIPSGPIELFSMMTLTRTTSCHPSRAEQLAIQSQAQGSTFLNVLGQDFTDVKKHGLNTIISQAVKVDPFVGGHDSQSSEYPWKDSVIFRFPLPENILSLDFEEDYQMFMKSPPKIIRVTVFERTFFSDNKLGEISLPLSTVSSETVFKEWLPLSQKDKAVKSSSWFLHIQASLKFCLMSLSDSPSLAPSFSASESPDLGIMKTKRFGESVKYFGPSLSQHSLASVVRHGIQKLSFSKLDGLAQEGAVIEAAVAGDGERISTKHSLDSLPTDDVGRNASNNTFAAASPGSATVGTATTTHHSTTTTSSSSHSSSNSMWTFSGVDDNF